MINDILRPVQLAVRFHSTKFMFLVTCIELRSCCSDRRSNRSSQPSVVEVYEPEQVHANHREFVAPLSSREMVRSYWGRTKLITRFAARRSGSGSFGTSPPIPKAIARQVFSGRLALLSAWPATRLSPWKITSVAL